MFLTCFLVEVGPAVGRLRKIHEKMPDDVVRTVKLGRLINICGHFNTHKKKLCKSKDGTGWDVHFPVFKGPVMTNKILPYKNSGTEMLIYRHKLIQNFSTALFQKLN